MMKAILLTLLITLSFFGLIAQNCGVIYISPNGATSGTTGTKNNPANLQYGLSLVSANDSLVLLATGTYTLSNTVNIPSGAYIEGGFDIFDWSKSNAAITNIVRNTQNVDVTNQALVALQADNQSNFRLQDISITVNDAPAGVTTYGVHLMNCSNYTILRCSIDAGEGGDGANGTNGTNGGDGANGGLGGPGDDDGTSNANGGGGGNGFGPSGVGGAGGTGSGGSGANAAISGGLRAGGGGGGGGAGGYDDDNGGSGGTGGGVQGAFGTNNVGGGAGIENGSCNDNNEGACGSPNIVVGKPGGHGLDGLDGPTGTTSTGGLHTSGYWAPGSGIDGGPGTGGQGGRGGGGGGGEEGEFNPFGQGCSAGQGNGGGGGGGGGQGGEEGTAGLGGGSSYAIYLHNNGMNGNIIDCGLTTGSAGTGGTGGTAGTGGLAGAGGNGGTQSAGEIGCGGDGGNGGDGGDGGAGGNGTTGESNILFTSIAGISPTVSGTSGAPNPAGNITVDNTGCIGNLVVFSTSVGNNWDFGLDANPATATGVGPHYVRYSSMGRKTITLDGTALTEFVNMYTTGGGGTDFISPDNGQYAIGCTNSFISTVQGSFYNWQFSDGGGNSFTISGAGLDSIGNVNFPATGVYTVILEITTNSICCGDAKDTTIVTISDGASSIDALISEDTICSGTSVDLSVTGGQTYTWSSIPPGTTSNDSMITTTPLISTIYIAHAAGCSGSIYDTVAIIVMPGGATGIGNFYSELCIQNSPVFLTGIPPGGTFSGTGMIGDYFAPKAAEVGTHTITYTLGCGSISQDVTVIPEPCDTLTGISYINTKGNGMLVYPNPFNNSIDIGLFGAYQNAEQIILIDMTGKIIFQTFAESNNFNETFSINTEHLESGIYYLLVKGKGVETSRKIIKLR